MKLLFPLFASLMLQYQVNTEILGWRKCLMGFGKCKAQCEVDEREVQKCKRKKCCVEPKVIQMIKDYLQNELSHSLEEESQSLLPAGKNDSVEKKRSVISQLSQIRSVPSLNIITPNSSLMTFSTTNPETSEPMIYIDTSTNKDSKTKRDSAMDSPLPSPPP
ncbi:beta-defensin 129 [Sorex araneus]|uniref:beta-defensin 129 n=1 Tax=Sorex araneus TaxID=42254 RepID=UPI000331506E|nr:beta-defensin 129 [Sorex araneus]